MFKNLLCGLCVALILVVLCGESSGGSKNANIAGVYKGEAGTITISEVPASQIREMASLDGNTYLPGVVWEETYKTGNYNKNYKPRQMNLGPIYAVTVNLKNCQGVRINRQLTEYTEHRFSDLDLEKGTFPFQMGFVDKNTVWFEIPRAMHDDIKGYCEISSPHFTKIK